MKEHKDSCPIKKFKVLHDLGEPCFSVGYHGQIIYDVCTCGADKEKEKMITKIILKSNVYTSIAETYNCSSKERTEKCGLIPGKIKNKVSHGTEIKWIKNIATRGELGCAYNMDPQEMMDVLKHTSIITHESEKDLSAIVHTHPNGEPVPSLIDIESAKKSGYKTIYIIAGKSPETHSFRIQAYYWNGDTFQEVPITIE